MAKQPWTLDESVSLCRAIERVAPLYGCHVALTGGTLYKNGPRKDCDILFYRIRQWETIDQEGLFEALKRIGIMRTKGFGWVHKATYNGRDVDLFFPEHDDGEYDHGDR